MSFISKVERQKCWDSRDRYWDCLDTNAEEHERCLKLRQAYENSCPAQWVSVIVNKRQKF
jgi:cytochrome c oxidase assembly factor 6